MNRSNEERVKIAVLPSHMQVCPHQYCLDSILPLVRERLGCAEHDFRLVIGTSLKISSSNAAIRPSLPPSANYRDFNWTEIEAREAGLAMIFAGHRDWLPKSTEYVIPDDSISHFADCAYWVVVGELQTAPILPVRPVITVPCKLEKWRASK